MLKGCTEVKVVSSRAFLLLIQFVSLVGRRLKSNIWENRSKVDLKSYTYSHKNAYKARKSEMNWINRWRKVFFFFFCIQFFWSCWVKFCLVSMQSSLRQGTIRHHRSRRFVLQFRVWSSVGGCTDSIRLLQSLQSTLFFLIGPSKGASNSSRFCRLQRAIWRRLRVFFGSLKLMQQAAWASASRGEVEVPLERNLIIHGLPLYVTDSILFQALQQNPGIHSIRILPSSRNDISTLTGVVRASQDTSWHWNL